jgi:hypothetical protein
MPSERPRDPWHELPGVDDTVVVRPRGSTVVPDDEDTVLRARGRSTATAAQGAGASARPAPRLHGVRVAGRDLLLDVPVVVGRRPTAPRVVAGVTPRLVEVPSPSHEVSGSHVEVRQHGETVVVTDLRSTNGTRVTEPGRVPVSLRQGESLVARAGTIVDVGDGNLLEILPPQRIIPTKEPLL